MNTVDRILNIAENVADRVMHRRRSNKMMVAASALAIIGAAAAVGFGAYKAMHSNGSSAEGELDLG